MEQIGARIRQARLERGLSQGDLENRTGLLRCYLSRVENGHTEPSLQTLARLATAMDMPLVDFFQAEADGAAAPRALTQEDLGFLTAMRECVGGMSDASRKRVLELARKMATLKPEDS
ncbi:MAG TPA: helix-turn-helix transcriptional regulator [Terriglobales bacterium]|nr:helix-turn-helix transcriptional regulator [Terriglobales bacterium]